MPAYFRTAAPNDGPLRVALRFAITRLVRDVTLAREDGTVGTPPRFRQSLLASSGRYKPPEPLPVTRCLASPVRLCLATAPMNTPFRFSLALIVVGAAFLLAACSTSPMSRIDSNRSVYESWPVDVQDAVLHQRAIPGMTPEMVEMAMGKPTEVQSRTGKDGSSEDVWIYRKSSGAHLPSILENANVSVGTSTNIGGVGVGTSAPIRRGGNSRGGNADAEDQEIVFRNGTVLRGSS